MASKMERMTDVQTKAASDTDDMDVVITVVDDDDDDDDRADSLADSMLEKRARAAPYMRQASRTAAGFLAVAPQ
jgi:hypothetical protein